MCVCEREREREREREYFSLLVLCAVFINVGFFVVFCLGFLLLFLFVCLLVLRGYSV